MEQEVNIGSSKDHSSYETRWKKPQGPKVIV